jgi:MinD-like ATPase involved in chromosome partitioning or flagellar assembly
VHADAAVPASVRRRTPFLLNNPRSRAASDVRKIAGEIVRDIGARGGPARKRPNVLRQLLESIAPSAASV